MKKNDKFFLNKDSLKKDTRRIGLSLNHQQIKKKEKGKKIVKHNKKA